LTNFRSDSVMCISNLSFQLSSTRNHHIALSAFMYTSLLRLLKTGPRVINKCEDMLLIIF